MAKRKTPVLLRPAPMTGGINVITNYKKIPQGDSYILSVIGDGKHDVTADYDAIVLEYLFPTGPDSSLVTSALDGVARGLDDQLTEEERQAIGAFRERIIKLLDRHNTTGHGSGT